MKSNDEKETSKIWENTSTSQISLCDLAQIFNYMFKINTGLFLKFLVMEIHSVFLVGF